MCSLASKQACQDRFLFTFPLTGVQGSEINPGVWDKPVLSPPPPPAGSAADTQKQQNRFGLTELWCSTPAPPLPT